MVAPSTVFGFAGTFGNVSDRRALCMSIRDGADIHVLPEPCHGLGAEQKNMTDDPKLLRVAPVFRVRSGTVRKMRDFFVEKLGFTVGTEVGRGPAFVTLDRDGLTVMLSCKPALTGPPRDWAAYFWVDDVGKLFEEMTERGVATKSGLTDKDYGCREFVVIAPDGRQIVFGQLMRS
jgi:hypothetical protein